MNKDDWKENWKSYKDKTFFVYSMTPEGENGVIGITKGSRIDYVVTKNNNVEVCFDIIIFEEDEHHTGWRMEVFNNTETYEHAGDLHDNINYACVVDYVNLNYIYPIEEIPIIDWEKRLTIQYVLSNTPTFNQ